MGRERRFRYKNNKRVGCAFLDLKDLNQGSINLVPQYVLNRLRVGYVMASFLNTSFTDSASDRSLLRVSGNEGRARQPETATLFSQGLKKGLGVEVKPSPENDPSSKVFDVQAVVDTVSGFIEQAIAERRIDGATQDQLNEMVSQAREGVERGFQLARDDIASIGRLEPELENNIDAAESGISERIDQIEVDLKSNNEEGVLTQLSSTAFSESKSLVRSTASFEFDLTTQEGDRVRVSVQELFEKREQLSRLQTNESSASSFVSRTSAASTFSIDVNGNLDEEERIALDALLVKVADISDAFFSGGVKEAFDQAVALEFDSTQIATFSLDLKSSTLKIYQQTEVRTTLQNSRMPEEYRAPQIPLGLQSSLSAYADQVAQLIESAKEFSSKLGLVDSGTSLAKELQRSFDQSVARGNAQNELFDALLEQRS